MRQQKCQQQKHNNRKYHPKNRHQRQNYLQLKSINRLSANNRSTNTEVPTTEQPAPAFPSHDDADSTPPKYDDNDYSAGVVPPSPGTIDIPELPDTPVSPVELSDSESEYSSLEEDDDLLGIKPGKFKPTDGEAYYAALDKQVCELVTREIGKSKKSHQDKESKATSKQKQKVKKHAKLPDTGENVFMYVLASVSCCYQD
ncbi:hypothetical protein CA207_21540 [Macrococcoides caseolyticum]|uniref:hypothetical protein n=1 Tax=Macrococcoides caseolyticum TaxID=69966 RepID=UPI000A292439|nr:hypothetical protein [Macrococcus caseolyticus]ARQ05347.1 hypothetical protein CA207_21540 [Macrococcus caseolyticus]